MSTEAEAADICRQLGLLLESHSNSEQTDHLLAIEDSIASLRAKAAVFLEEQKTDLEAADSLNDLVPVSDAKLQRRILRGRSLSRAFRTRAYRERKAIHSVLQKMDNLYSSHPDTKRELVGLCFDLAEMLDKSTMVKNAYFESINGILKSCRSRKARQDSQTAVSDKILVAQMDGGTFEGQDHSIDKNVDADQTDALILFPFLRHNQTTGVHKVLVVGKEGTGKTYLCNEIERSVWGGSQVHRLNAFGRTIGELEDTFLSLFNSASAEGTHKHYILLVDDFDEAVGSGDLPTTTGRTDPSETKQSHASARAFSAFLTAMDSPVTIRCHSQTKMTLICLAKTNLNVRLARFDTVHILEAPVYEERRKALAGIVECNNLPGPLDGHVQKQIEATLDELAATSVGLSHAEIAQNCRQAIMVTHDRASEVITKEGVEDTFGSTLRVLGSLKEALQSFAPASLRSGVVDGYVDMRVLSSEDLLDPSRYPSNGCPLFGLASETAWKELESSIVIPLCRSAELDNLLFNQKKPLIHGGLSCGAVLTGPPGCGKSTLAQHVAVLAAKFLPSVKLLEVSCTSMIHKEVGASEKAIHHLFECARNAAPCIVVLDDVAIVSSVRGKDNTTEGTMDRVLSTLLTELDGASTGGTAGIGVLGITQNVGWVDPALLRPGRLGRIVALGMPHRDTRRRIALRELEIYFCKSSHERSNSGGLLKLCVELSEVIADHTEGMTGSSVIALCNDSKRSCVLKVAADATAQVPGPEELLTSMRNFVLHGQSRGDDSG